MPQFNEQIVNCCIKLKKGRLVIRSFHECTEFPRAFPSRLHVFGESVPITLEWLPEIHSSIKEKGLFELDLSSKISD